MGTGRTCAGIVRSDVTNGYELASLGGQVGERKQKTKNKKTERGGWGGGKGKRAGTYIVVRAQTEDHFAVHVAGLQPPLHMISRGSEDGG